MIRTTTTTAAEEEYSVCYFLRADGTLHTERGHPVCIIAETKNLSVANRSLERLLPSRCWSIPAIHKSIRTMVNSIGSRIGAGSGTSRRALVVRAAVAVPKEIKTVTPLGDRVVVKTVVEEARTSSGIFLPSSSQAKPNQGAIVSVAANVEDVKAGDVVVYSKYAGTEVDIDDVHHVILKNDDLVGVLAAGADVSEMKPLQDRVLIKVDEVAESTTGGLLLTDSSKDEPTIGTVVAVGPGNKNGDEIITPGSTVGSKVMYQKFSGAEFEGAGGAKYIVVRDSDIIATVA